MRSKIKKSSSYHQLKALNFFNGEKIAIIPARGGSQRVKLKNLKTIKNRTLINRAIDSCIESNIFDKIIVSTDSLDIENSVNNSDIDIHKRSLLNSRNISSTEDVIKEIFNYYSNSFEDNALIFLVQCTSPFLKYEDLKKSFSSYKDDIYINSVFSGYEFNKFIWEKKDKIIYPINYLPQKRPRTQDKKPILVENGAFYIFGKYNFDITSCRLHGKVDCFLMNELRSIDIDDEKDLEIANFISNFVEK